MPELPEVETIVRALNLGGRGGDPIIGQVVRSAEVLWNRTLAAPSLPDFLFRLPGQKIDAVTRRGKFIVIHLDRDNLLIHLRMSGDLRVETKLDAERPYLPHDRAAIHFVDGSRLVFNDPRKFGRLWLAADPLSVLGKLGPEPFDEALKPEVFFRMLQSHHRQLKPLLMDQSFIAGLGNIYTDESLFLAKLHPLEISNQLTFTQAANLLDAVREVLKEGIRRNGSSIDWVYRGGEFQNDFRVYQRTGQPCLICGKQIEKRMIGQRGTHFCPQCQQLSKNRN